GLAPHDSRYSDPFHIEAKVPISAAEIFAAIAPYLQEPKSELRDAALFTCLKHDIEGSRAITRTLLRHHSGAVRLVVAGWYLHHGHDDGALGVIEALYDTAPSDLENKDPGWYKLKTSWSFICDCCRTSAEPLRTKAAQMVMRIIRKTLDAPDW